MKVVHVITCLGQGGAEGVLFRLVTSQSMNATNHIVVSLQDLGFYGPKLVEKGIRVIALDMPKGGIRLSSLYRLYSVFRLERPDVVQTWMYHSDLIGGFVARCARIRNIAWGIRHANLDRDKNSRVTLAIARLCAKFSNLIPRAIVSCSEEATATHKKFGYAQKKFVNIPNGYDLTRFCPDPEARARLRFEWKAAPQEILLGCIARWDVQKDHPNLLSALNILVEQGFNGRCILVGTGMDQQNEKLTALIRSLRLERCVTLLGPRDDVPSIMNAIDINILPSSGEAFPNVLAEAMACGVPSVTTDVGDARLIVGDTGWLVRPQNPDELAAGIAEAISQLGTPEMSDRTVRCRVRVQEHFSLSKMVSAFENVWSHGRDKVGAGVQRT